jgi:hypothetical protein
LAICLVLLSGENFKLACKARGLLAGLGGHLAGFVALGLRLPGFMRGSGTSFFVDLCCLGGLLLDAGRRAGLYGHAKNDDAAGGLWVDLV